MRLFAALITALKNTLLYALEAGWQLLCLPLRMLVPPQGRSAIPAPPQRQESQYEIDRMLVKADHEAAQAFLDASRLDDTREMGRRTETAKVLSWAAGVAAGIETPFPAGLRMRTAAWAKNLRPSEVGSLARAGFTAIFDHVDGRSRIDGVPSVADLTARRPVSPIQTAIRVRRLPAASPEAAVLDYHGLPAAPQFASAAR